MANFLIWEKNWSFREKILFFWENNKFWEIFSHHFPSVGKCSYRPFIRSGKHWTNTRCRVCSNLAIIHPSDNAMSVHWKKQWENLSFSQKFRTFFPKWPIFLTSADLRKNGHFGKKFLIFWENDKCWDFFSPFFPVLVNIAYLLGKTNK